MSSKATIDQLVGQIVRNLPPIGMQAGEALRDSLGQALQAALQRMDLVSREEYDVQTEVLARTREKLHALEAQIQALEERLKQ